MGCAPSAVAAAADGSGIVALRGVLQERASTHGAMAAVTQPALLNSALLHLHMPGVALSADEADIVGRALAFLPVLQTLDLRDCGLDGDGIASLANGMGAARLSALQTLLLGGNWQECMFGAAVACVEAIGSGLVLGGATSLTTLSVPNGMLPKGAAALCEALVALSPPLTALDVSDSRFGCGGARALRDAHRRAPFASLQHLDLFACHIGPRGAEAFCETLRDAPSAGHPCCALPLRTLCLADNAIEDYGLAAFARAYRSNRRVAASLTDLDLSSNGIGLEGDRYAR